MSKGIELTPSQIKAYGNGATMFMFPIDRLQDWIFEGIVKSDSRTQKPNELFAKFRLHEKSKTTQGYRLPLQKGDKDVQIRENAPCPNCQGGGCPLCCGCGVIYSYIGKLKEVLDVRVVREQDITPYEIKNCIGNSSFIIGDDFEQYKFNKKKFEDIYNIRIDANNDYVFLIEIKR